MRNVQLFARVEGIEAEGVKRAGTDSEFKVSGWAILDDPAYGGENQFTHARVTDMALTVGGEAVPLVTAELQTDRKAVFGRAVRWMTNRFPTALPDGTPTEIDLVVTFKLERHMAPFPSPLPSTSLEDVTRELTVTVTPNVYNVGLRVATRVAIDMQGNQQIYAPGTAPPKSYPYVAEQAAQLVAAHYAAMNHALLPDYDLTKGRIVIDPNAPGDQQLDRSTTFMAFTHGTATNIWDSLQTPISTGDVTEVAQVSRGLSPPAPHPTMAWHYACSTGAFGPQWAAAYGFAVHQGQNVYAFFANRALSHFNKKVWSMLAPNNTAWNLTIPISQVDTVLSAGLHEHSNVLFDRLSNGQTAEVALDAANLNYPPRTLSRVLWSGNQMVSAVFRKLDMTLQGSSVPGVRGATLNRVFGFGDPAAIADSNWYLVFVYDPVVSGSQNP